MTDDRLFTEEDVEELELLCWKDSARLCGSECAAYDRRCESDPRWTSCMILNSNRAQARGVNALAAALKEITTPPETVVLDHASAKKKAEAEAYAQKVKEMDIPPPKART